jgi:hypothetical protein
VLGTLDGNGILELSGSALLRMTFEKHLELLLRRSSLGAVSSALDFMVVSHISGFAGKIFIL